MKTYVIENIAHDHIFLHIMAAFNYLFLRERALIRATTKVALETRQVFPYVDIGVIDQKDALLTQPKGVNLID